MSKPRILLVEDDRALREALADTLALGGYDYLEAGDGESALALLQRESVCMVVSDVNMPGMDGHGLLRALRQQHPHLPVLLMTAYGTVQNAVGAMRDGAVDYLVKPFEPKALLDLLGQYALGRLQSGKLEGPVAVEPASQQLLQLASRVAASDSTVLISGESGTGKEVLARYIHQASARAQQPFIAINCAAIPDNMLEATLFGHEKGAFTGAVTAQSGKFEQANGGTLFLDEIGDMPSEAQTRLLRALQSGSIRRVGGRSEIAVNVRIVAATNRALGPMIAAGTFREDLFYRLNVVPIELPPLRERREDIAALARHFLGLAANEGLSRHTITDGAVEELAALPWRGNVRELRNVVFRLALNARQEAIDRSLVEEVVAGETRAPGTPATDGFAAALDAFLAENAPRPGTLYHAALARFEKPLVEHALRAMDGNQLRAAELLGINRNTLRKKLDELEIEPERFARRR